MMGSILSRHTINDIPVTTVERVGCCEHILTIQLYQTVDFIEVWGQVVNALEMIKAVPVSIDVFGVPFNLHDSVHDVLGTMACPITWLEGRCGQEAPIKGIQVWAVSGTEVRSVVLDSQSVGRIFTAGEVQYCRLGGLISNCPEAPRRYQTRYIFELMEAALATVGMTFSNVVRTWFYNDDLLDWYDDFNVVRTQFFVERGLFDSLVPASTGIGCHNGAGSALMAGLLAVADAGHVASPKAIVSPLQRPSFEYGSAFSRAVVFSASDIRRLLISGTASIAPHGESVHIGDTRAQIHRTLDVVYALLESQDMDWPNISRAIAYFKYTEDSPLWAECLKERHISHIPALIVNTDICRSNLLFELEVDAVAR